MKKSILFFFALWAMSVCSFAQNEIQFSIHHRLAESNFAAGIEGGNNINHEFKLDRIEYYVSKVSIIHDGGMETTIDDFWMLIDATKATQVSLGTHAIDAVERIKFHIGVEPEYNHLDPASYELGHPLAPQLPSMHWGWNSGYRFVVLEGDGSSSFNQPIELHGMGDDNYFSVEVEPYIITGDNQIDIHIDADYARGLENIETNSGLLVHGFDFEAKTVLENFRDFVFGPSSMATDVLDLGQRGDFNLYPNPATRGRTAIFVNGFDEGDYAIKVNDMLGREVRFVSGVRANTSVDLNLDQSGTYIVNLLKEGQSVISKKLLIN